MQSTMMALGRQRDCATKSFNNWTCAVVIGLAGFAATISPTSALSGASGALPYQLRQDSPVIEVVVRRGAVGRPGVVRPGVVRPGGWVRPAHYYWRPGGAIAAGVAIGFVAAAIAAAWAGAPPAPGYCWYYTDPSRTQGFWDVCP
jgi:hypothetical protein